MASFSRESIERLEMCHPILQRIADAAIKVIDFGIIESFRDTEDQWLLYQQGRTKPGPIVTKIDGRTTLGRHNRTPAEAFDACPWKPGKGFVWNDLESFHVMGGVFLGIASMMDLEYPVRWGGNWDKDPYFTEKGDYWDLPHLEVLVPH